MNRIDGANPALTGRTMEGLAAKGADRAGEGAAAEDAVRARGRQDNVLVSDRARLMSVATTAVRDAPDARAAKVAALKAAIADGSYSVQPRELAARLLRGGGLD